MEIKFKYKGKEKTIEVEDKILEKYEKLYIKLLFDEYFFIGGVNE
jgi:hypothetical protein